MRVFAAQLLAAILCFAASPAQALCEKYDKPLDRPQLLQLVDEVRDAFPARYRSSLDKVEVEVSDERGFSPYLVQSREQAILTAPATMLREYCSIAQWGFYARNMTADERQQLIGELWRRCGKQPDPQLCRILSGEAIVTSVDTALKSDKKYQNTKYMIDQLQRSAVAFALAHELGHALIDGHPDFRRKPKNFDAEFEADALAYSVFSTGIVWPGSQSFLYQAIATVSADEEKADIAGSPHEALLCRLAKAEAMEGLIGENLGKLFLWRAQSDSLLVVSPLTQTGSVFQIVAKEPRSGCDLATTPEASAIAADLAHLVEIVESAGPEARGNKAPFRQLAAANLSSRFGKSMRNGMVASALSGPLLSTYQMALIGKVQPDLPARMRAINATYSLLPESLDMSARDYRNLLGARAFGSFLSQPSGSSLAANLAALEGEVAKGRTFATDGLTDTLLQAAQVVVGGKCGDDTRELMKAMTKGLLAPMLDAMRISAFAGRQNVDIEAMEAQAESMMVLAAAEPKEGQAKKCSANARARADEYKQVLGWVD